MYTLLIGRKKLRNRCTGVNCNSYVGDNRNFNRRVINVEGNCQKVNRMLRYIGVPTFDLQTLTSKSSQNRATLAFVFGEGIPLKDCTLDFNLVNFISKSFLLSFSNYTNLGTLCWFDYHIALDSSFCSFPTVRCKVLFVAQLMVIYVPDFCVQINYIEFKTSLSTLLYS